MNKIEDTLPWYKQFWPWFLIAIPVITVISGVAMLLIASHEPDTVVVDDYYKKGLAINMTLARDEKAKQLGLQAVGRLDKETRSITLDLYGKNDSKKLRLALTHPAAAAQDIVIDLMATDKKNKFTGQLPVLPMEKRYILLEPVDKSWRLTGHAQFPGMLQWSLRPGL